MKIIDSLRYCKIMVVTVTENSIVFKDVDAYEPPSKVYDISKRIIAVLGVKESDWLGSHDKRMIIVEFHPNISEARADELTRVVRNEMNEDE